MKIKDTLDLCGWELWNFCIQNHQNLEGLLDLGAGRKVFYTGNDQVKNGREVIYDGSKWKVSAYMSDVEGVQNNLSALTERVNAFLDGEVNSNDVLDNLKEIQAFLDAYPEATSLVQILDTKLDKEGGTITGVLTAKSAVSIHGRFSIYGLQEYRTTENHAVYMANNYYTGSGDGKGLAIYTDSSWYDLLHSGNVGEYAVLAGVYNENDVTPALNTVGLLNGVGAYAKFGYGSYWLELYTKAGSLHLINHHGSSDISEKTIAFTDSTVASAYKLVTSAGADAVVPYADGYTNVYGDLWVWAQDASERYVKLRNSLSDLYTRLKADGSGEIFVSGRYALKLGTGNTTRMLINSSGNVTIGDQDLAGTGYRLWVNGPTNVEGNLRMAGELIFAGGYSIQSYNSTALSINPQGNNILLSPNGYSNVLIGTTEDNGAKLQVDGPVSFKDEINVWEGTTKNRLTFYEYQGIGRIYSYNNTDNTFGDLCIGNNIGDILKVKANGNILIGTPSPLNETSKLQIKGDLYVEGNIIATKEVSAGGAATEGNGGAGGFSLYESWGTSAPTEPLALGANLGYELKTRVEDLELAKTKVTFEPALASGKQIGTIEIDGNKTNLFAPATYAWSEITGTENVLTTAGGTMTGNLTIRRSPSVITFETADGSPRGSLGIVAAGPVYYDAASVGYDLLHAGNYSEYALPLSGGTIEGKDTVNGLLSINVTNHVGYGSLIFKVNGSSAAAMGISSTNEVFLQNVAEGSNKKIFKIGHTNLLYGSDTLLHSGNVGEYNAGSADVIAKTYVENINYNDKKSALKLIQTTGGGDSGVANGFPTNYCSGLSVMTDYTGWQMVSYGGDRVNPWFRKVQDNGTWSDWKTIAFTDSNVASAQALTHSNGTVGAMVGEAGNLCINKRISSADDSLNLFEYNAGFLYLGYSLRNEHTTRVYGNKIEFLMGDTQRMLINPFGNVTIGGSDLAGTGYKLYVDGLAYTYSFAATGSLSLNRNPNNGTIYNSATLALAIESSGDAITFGAYRGDSSKIGVPLAFSKSGNVGIGTADPKERLDIEGGIRVNGHIYPKWGNNSDLGKNSQRWNNIFAVKASFTEDVIIDGDLHVKGNIIADGEVSAGGAGTEGGTSGGGTSTNPHVETFTPSTETSYAFYHNLPYYDVVVQVYEKNAISGAWDMILADVTIANESNLVTVNFGRKEDVEHKIVVR